MAQRAQEQADAEREERVGGERALREDVHDAEEERGADQPGVLPERAAEEQLFGGAREEGEEERAADGQRQEEVGDGLRGALDARERVAADVAEADDAEA